MTVPAVLSNVRKLWPTDLAAFREHLLRLDPESRRARFGMGASDEFLRTYAETGFTLAAAIHGAFDGDRLVGAGELRAIGGGTDAAEAAFSIETAWRGRGIGTTLMRRTLLTARNRGIGKVYINCLATNRAMQRLARRHGATLEFDSGDVVGLVEPARASAASLLRETVADGYGWATAIFDLQTRLLKSA